MDCSARDVCEFTCAKHDLLAGDHEPERARQHVVRLVEVVVVRRGTDVAWNADSSQRPGAGLPTQERDLPP